MVHNAPPGSRLTTPHSSSRSCLGRGLPRLLEDFVVRGIELFGEEVFVCRHVITDGEVEHRQVCSLLAEHPDVVRIEERGDDQPGRFAAIVIELLEQFDGLLA